MPLVSRLPNRPIMRHGAKAVCNPAHDFADALHFPLLDAPLNFSLRDIRANSPFGLQIHARFKIGRDVALAWG